MKNIDNVKLDIEDENDACVKCEILYADKLLVNNVTLVIKDMCWKLGAFRMKRLIYERMLAP